MRGNGLEHDGRKLYASSRFGRPLLTMQDAKNEQVI
jgi:hypothetical protein